MMLEKIRIVLVNPSHPGNIGATARAMKTMGLSRLFLVKPKEFPHTTAAVLAAGADDVLDRCQVTSTLKEALAGCHFVIATSARERRLPWPSCTPHIAAKQALQAAAMGEVAILFGSERVGLLNSELQMAHVHLIIPANPDYSSLNLAAAVQLVCYELRMAFLNQVEELTDNTLLEEPPAKIEEVEAFYQHLQKMLWDIQFLKEQRPRKLMNRLRRLFQRAKLSQVEVNILRGILTAIEKVLLTKSLGSVDNGSRGQAA